MKKSTVAKIKRLGFADMGDHFSLHKNARTVTLTERTLGESVMLEVMVTVKTRLLTAYEKETLAKIAVTNRMIRLENINIGEQTSILLSMILPEDEIVRLGEYIKSGCKFLDKILKRVDDEKEEIDDKTLVDICS